MKYLGYLIGAALVIGLVLGLYGLLWLGWCWMMPQLWQDGPKNIVSPSYWLFVVAFLVLTVIGRAVFGGGKKE